MGKALEDIKQDYRRMREFQAARYEQPINELPLVILDNETVNTFYHGMVQ